jgi:hypothetical protein
MRIRRSAATALQGFTERGWQQRAAFRPARLAACQIEASTCPRNHLLRGSDYAGMDHSVATRKRLVAAWVLADILPLLEPFHPFGRKRWLGEAPGRPLLIAEALIMRSKTLFTIPVEQRVRQIYLRQVGRPSSQVWARDMAQS